MSAGFDAGDPSFAQLGDGNSSAILEDVDGDGISDAILFKSSRESFEVRLGNGEGSFGGAESVAFTYSSGVRPILADITGDGLPDVVGIREGSGGDVELTYRINTGRGSFANGVDLVLGSGTDSGFLVAGDVDTDGDVDVLFSQDRGNNDDLFFQINNLSEPGDGFFRGFEYESTQINFRGDAGVVGDLNNDGLNDLALVGTDSRRYIDIFLGNSSGPNFAAPIRYETGANSNLRALHTVDYNGDGRLDLLTHNGDATYLFFNSDNFEGVSLAGPSDEASADAIRFLGAESTAVGDINGDGFGDFVVAGTGPNLITVFLGNAGGTLEPMNFDARVDLFGIAIGHTDGDPFTDVIAWDSAESEAEIFRGDPDQLLSGVQSRYLDAFRATAAHLVDVNDDGYLDAIVGNRNGNNTLYVVLGHGDGFGMTVESNIAGNAQYHLETGDFNSDGRIDVVYSTGSNIQIAFGAGDGTFSDSGINFATGSNVRAIAVGDVTGDGYDDLAVVGSRFLVLHNQAGASLTQAESINAVNNAEPQDTIIADLNGNGLLDFAWSENDRVWVGQNTGEGRISAYAGSMIGPEDYQVGGLVAIDFNEDGLLDFAAIAGNGMTGGSMYFGINDGAGLPRFREPGSLAIPDGLTDVDTRLDVADFNGDGRPDIYAWVEDYAGVVFTDADGLRNAVGLYGIGSVGLSAGDFDQDGDVDLVGAGDITGSTASKLVSIARNYGDGTFRTAAERHTFAGGTNAFAEAADFTGDGIADYLIRSTFSSGTARLDLLDGETRRVVWSTGVSNTDNSVDAPFVVGDFDGDGDHDFVYRQSTGFNFWINDGTGMFASAPPADGSRTVITVASGDVNGDGVTDAVVGEFNPASGRTQFRAYAWNGSSFAALVGPVGVSDEAVFTQLADMDRDGAIDLVVLDSNRRLLFVPDLMNAGSTPSTVTIMDSAPFERFTVSDVDGDGDPDLIGMRTSGVDIIPNLTTPGGFFFLGSEALELSGRNNQRDVVLEDFDGNGRSSVGYETNDGFRLVELVRTNSGAFEAGAEQTYAYPFAASQLFAFDADADGDADLVGLRSDGSGGVWALDTVINRDRGVNRLTAGDGPFDASDRPIDGAFAADGSIAATTANSRGEAVFFYKEEGGEWTADDLAELIGVPTVVGDAVTWSDASTGNYMVAVLTAEGLMLAERTGASEWQVRNLNEINATRIVDRIVQLTGNDGSARLVGISADGRFVMFQQWVSDPSRWSFVDLSTDHLAAQGQGTPGVRTESLTTYVTRWGGLNVAGLDSSGNVHTVWWSPGLSLWQTNNLTEITGAAPVQGPLSVYLTSWGGINIAGLTSGEIRTTWWVPGFGGEWRDDSITENAGGPMLAQDTFTSYTSSWDGLNLVGTDADTGELTIYWWVPGFERWVVSPLSEAIESGAPRPAGALTATVSSGNTFNIFGSASNGEALRYFWQPGGEWTVENLTERVS